MAGRKPLPDGLKLVKGTLRNHRVNKDAPMPCKGSHTAPDYLSPVAAEEFERKAEALSRLNVYTEWDDTALAAYAEAYARWREAIAELQKTGLIVKTQQGNVIQSPLVGVANRAADLMHKFLTEFGLTPSSRTRIKVSAEPKATEWEVFSNHG